MSVEAEEAKGHYRKKTKLDRPFDQSYFLKLIALDQGDGCAINAVFRKLISNFLKDDVYKYIEQRLRQRCQELERMINE